MFKLKSIKTQLIIYLLLFALFLAIKDRDFTFLFTTFIAVISALAFEILIVYLRTKKFIISESAIITGLIVGYLISGDEALWKFVLAAFIAISSKQLISFRGKHIFNPAGLGIFLVTIFFGVSTWWKGTYLWYIVVPFGFYFAHKIRKLEIITGYFLASFLLFLSQSFFLKTPLLNVFGYFSYFYIFVMVIEPKTTPINFTGKYFFGIGLAALIFIFTGIGVKFDVELFSLLAMNMFVPLLNKVTLKKVTDVTQVA